MSVSQAAERIREQVRKAIVGQDAAIDQILVAFLAGGHVLLEGVPGIAKTLTVRSFAKALNLEYGRIQLTPDMMPSDIIGTSIFDPKAGDFRLRKGPIFVNVLLADEINRTPPKTQSALLEAMEERRVTIDGEPHPLPQPFTIFATQNPIEFEGTYPLPEAQQDRFLLKVVLGYPEPAVEVEVLRRHHQGFRPQDLEAAGIEAVLQQSDLFALQKEVLGVTVEDKVFDYIYQVVLATRESNSILYGASPRAGIALLNGAKAMAAMRDRNYVIPDDVKELAPAVLRHRVLLRPEAEIEGLTPDRVLAGLIEAQVVPR